MSLRTLAPTRRLGVLAGAALATLLMVIVIIAAMATPAAAEPDDSLVSNNSQTPSGLDWVHLEDSRGIDMWKFEMSIDRGGVTNPGKLFWAAMVDAGWGLYRSICAIGLWFIDWVMSFGWVDVIAAPLLAVGDAMRDVVTTMGLVPTFLTLTALAGMFLMVRGRGATGIWEIGIACVIAALAAGSFADPVRFIAGPDGLVVKTAEAGQELAAQIATGDSEGKTPEQLRKAQTGQLVDTFVRQPTQIINFGVVVDGTRCENAYNDVVRAGPYGLEADIRDAMKKCDSGLGEYAANPSGPMALGAAIFSPAGFIILGLAAVLGGTVITAGVRAMFQSLKSIITLVTGLLPGGGRGSLLMSVAETLVALLLILFASVFLSVFLLVIQALFSNQAGGEIARTFAIVDIIIFVGLFVYWRQHSQIKALSGRLAQAMAHRPGGGGPTRLPDRSPAMLAPLAASAGQAVTNVAMLRRKPPVAAGGGPTLIDQRQQLMVVGMPGNRPGPGPITVPPGPGNPGPGGPGGPKLLPGGPDQLPPGPGVPQLPPGASGGPQTPPNGPAAAGAPSSPTGPRQPSPAMARVEAADKRKKVAGTLARAGTTVALSAVSGGTGAAAAGAVKAAGAVRTARRVALASRMATTAGRTMAGTGPGKRPATSTSRAGTGPSTRADHGRTSPRSTPRPTPAAPAGKGHLVGAGKGNPAAGKAPIRTNAPTAAPVRSHRPAPQPAPASPTATPAPTASPARAAATHEANEAAARLQRRLAERATARHQR